MLKGKSFLIFCVIIFSYIPLWAQYHTGYGELSSPAVGENFYELAYELANSEDAGPSEVDQALVFLKAASKLDSRSNYIFGDMIEFACRYSEPDRSEMVYNLLLHYVNESANLEIANKAIRYLLDTMNSREEREGFLGRISRELGSKNEVLNSEINVRLGLLKAEKADLEAALQHFMTAYNLNTYDSQAFSRFVELLGDQVEPAMVMEHLRLKVRENPLNLEAAVAFAQYADQLEMYDVATGAYEYCADLFGYLYPTENLPESIYFAWMLSSYNSDRNTHRCLHIIQRVRQGEHFDLLAEVIAGKAAAKIGNIKQAEEILLKAERNTLELVGDDIRSHISETTQLGWFYCFGLVNKDKAINWANRAYSIDPNSPVRAGILAYALVMNEQIEIAEQVIEGYDKNPLFDLALAQIQLSKGQNEGAFVTLKEVITTAAGTIEAVLAREILAANGGEYITPTDTDTILTVLKGTFGEPVTRKLVRPERIISVQLKFRGGKFSYGSKFGGTLVISNNSAEPLVISDESLFKGNIRIDAVVRGDLKEKIPNLISKRIRTALIIDPDRSLIVPLKLLTGRLRQLLLSHPQASVDIEFTAFIDPVITDAGKLRNSLADIKPAKITVKRSGVQLTGQYLRNRLDSFSNGRQGQKIMASRLFVGLLKEEQMMANRRQAYKYMYADWMPAILKNAIANALGDEDWIVATKVNTMAAMVSLPFDSELITAVAGNLHGPDWPQRLTAVYLLAKNQGSSFNKVLDWVAQHDSEELVREMAVVLGGKKVEKQGGKVQPRPVNDPNQAIEQEKP